MDPNATLGDIAHYLKLTQPGDGLLLDLACQDLYDWLTKGGFEPHWDQHPIASGYYRCRERHHRQGVRVDETDPDYAEVDA